GGGLAQAGHRAHAAPFLRHAHAGSGRRRDDAAEGPRPSAAVHHRALSAPAGRSLAALAEPSGSVGVAGAPAAGAQPACPGGPPMTTPVGSTRPAVEVAEVIRQHGQALLAQYGSTLTTDQHRALRALAACRTAALGGHVERCADCGHERIAYNS